MNKPSLARVASILLVFCWYLPGNAAAHAQAGDSIALMPMPAHVGQAQGELPIDGSFSVSLEGYTEPRLVLARERFLETLRRETGIPIAGDAKAGGATLTVKATAASKPVQELGEDESYRLEISASKAVLTAPNPLGVLHGLQTFLQLVRITPKGFAAPAVSIDDAPRFPWRGLMIDSGRHFQPVAVIKRNLDGMEAVKMNVFHWHISDDQGFRAESTAFPLFQEKGSNGQYYTQEQIRDVIEYAHQRGIRVVPEFDMPCHTTSWMAAYPDLASGSGPYQVATEWGVLDAAMDPTRESTYEFLDRFLAEMTALFPDAYFHIGGDECNGKEWSANARIQSYMHEHNIKDNAALQAMFTTRVQKLVAGHGKIMEGWDEVLGPDTPRDVVIHSWRGQKALAAAARQGNRGLLSTGYYIDLNEPAAKHYLVDPLSGDAAKLSPEETARILGGEATMWSEYTPPENIDSRIWPRTAAIAERLWSPQAVRDVDSMYERLAVVSQKLDNYGLTHRSFSEAMLERMSGETDPEALRVLAAVLQPPEGYAREELKHFDTSSALNRMVDAVQPESDVAREFNGLAKRIAAGKASPEQVWQARQWLETWRDNDVKLRPTLGKSELTEELVPVSEKLARVAAIGLRALDDIEKHHAADRASTDKDLAVLKAAEKPVAVLRDMIVPSVEILVSAAGGK